MAKSKYGNRKTPRGRIMFDSAKEAARYDELMGMLKAGVIQELKLQPEFTLQEGFTDVTGEKIRPIKYRADFLYKRRVREGGDIRIVTVIEDVKGYKTKEYELKRKMMADKGYTITEI